VGFRPLELEDYNEAARRLGADVTAALADIADTERVSLKRREKMADRTHAWLRDTLAQREELTGHSAESSHARHGSVFTSVLPLEAEEQQLYLADVTSEYSSQLAGLCMHDTQSAAAVPNGIARLPRFCLSDPPKPQDVLHAISLGIDMVTVPFVNAVTERGIAFSFEFPAPASSSTDKSGPLQLGVDVWQPNSATNVSPLSPRCACYACTRHHSAYVHHLLQAKEMLAWTLLQIHNLHTLDRFFAGVRDSLRAGSFEQDQKAFVERYEPDFPMQQDDSGTSRGPRVRGYQMRSEGKGQDRKKEKVWGRLGDVEGADGVVATPTADSENDLDRKVVEAIETGAAPASARSGRRAQHSEQDPALATAEDLERLGLGSKDT
jgi:queuine tRNA-ribosyltransferase accessory subunit